MTDKPIYPQVEKRVKQYPINHKGLNLLEYYAGLAMQGLLASGQYDLAPSIELAKFSVDYAKALIKELENEGH